MWFVENVVLPIVSVLVVMEILVVLVWWKDHNVNLKSFAAHHISVEIELAHDSVW